MPSIGVNSNNNLMMLNSNMSKIGSKKKSAKEQLISPRTKRQPFDTFVRIESHREAYEQMDRERDSYNGSLSRGD